MYRKEIIPTAKACDEFAKRVYRETDGRVNIEVYHGDTLGAEADQMEQVRVDGIDFCKIIRTSFKLRMKI